MNQSISTRLAGKTDEELNKHFEKLEDELHFEQHASPETCSRCADVARDRWDR